ncbi:MAG: PQQ-dependent sugar dehydrogenase [Planctomycetales bacterium]|nr:PQQ-dependent sugar dehydrogenase [Planctomycetales bacterium]
MCLQDHGNEVAFRNIKIRDRDRANPGGDAPQPRLKAVPAFTNLQWTGWESDGDDGRRTLLRAVLLDHANDGSDRVFVGIQQGRIHVFKNDDSVQKTKIFLDIADRVQYRDRENEEGFLGLAFHPNYKDNGKFYVYYTTTEAPRQSLISEFTVRSDDPDSADPASERVVMRIPQPYWNHNGGTICFGPDGYLYVALGDGGLGNDPHGNGQNLQTLLGSVLRIDVNSQDQGGYGIPQDNPFVGRQDARGEIWAYGIRNPWRITFDRQTGKLWLGEVGQNLWEEINVITRGGNYGWNVRESYHPFAAHGADPSSDFVEPIFEYGHDIGKSITGGYVYRGKKRPELQGAYLYADYVSSRVWALHVDHQTGKVLRNEEIDTPQGLAIASFGEDEQGEVYFLTIGADGKAIYQFMPRE